MDLASDTNLPFFAYGTLRPGEIAYFRIQAAVSDTRSAEVPGTLRLRDGLLIAHEQGTSRISGEVLSFEPAKAEAAYRAICDLEPSKQYRWDQASVQGEHVNILWGISPQKGSVPIDFDWSSWKDPLFTDALDVVEQELNAHQGFNWDPKQTFHVQMAYLLLWTSIERYASLRYHLGGEATAKVMKVAEEKAFLVKLREVVSETRDVQRADDPKKKLTLEGSDPRKSMEYYYQIRSNMVHRGKGMPNDHHIVLSSCRELTQIFRHVLKIAQCEAVDRRHE